MRAEIAMAALVLLPVACGVPLVEEIETDELRFPVTERARIEVRLARGAIRVEGTESSEVRVEVRKRARAARPDVARSMITALAVGTVHDRAGVRIEAPPLGGSLLGAASKRRRLVTDVTVHSPSQADLVLTTGDGSIVVRAVEGDIEAVTHNGGLRLERTRGTLHLRSFDGSIVGHALHGEVDALTEDGRLELAGSFTALRAVTGDGSIDVRCESALPLGRDWLLATSDGSIRLAIPASFSAQLQASSGDGRVTSDIALDPDRTGDRRLSGSLNDGSRNVLLRTLDGSIRIRLH